MLETKTLLLPSGVNLRITPSLALVFSLLRETKRFPNASTATPSTSKSVANVVLNPGWRDLLNRVSLAVAYEKISARIEHHRFRVRDSCERVFSKNDVVGRREFQHDILPKGANKQVGRGVSYA